MEREARKELKIRDLFDLKNNVAVVTGGAGFLGMSITEALAEAGADVFITSRNEKKCKKIVENLKSKLDNKIKGISMDMLSVDSIKNCFKQVVDDSGRIDILVNNAASIPEGKLEDISDDAWKTGIDGTINGVFRCTKEVTPIMEKNEVSSIINIASMYGEVSPDPLIYEDTRYDSPPHYGAGKAAIIQFTRHAACHLAKKGIRVNAISPGPFPNPEVQKNQNFINALKKKTPLNRIGHPHEIKGVVVFLASRASSYITGENIHVDGGWTAW